MAERDVKNNSSDHVHHVHEKQKKTCKAVMVFTPFLLLMMCIGVVTLAGYRHFQALTKYTNIIFNENISKNSSYKDNEYRVSDAPQIKGEVEVKKEDKDNSETETHKIEFPYVGDVYAHITVDNKDANIKNAPVIWGVSDSLLEKGVCQANYSAYIGDTGRVVLCAHNHTFFYGLPKLKIGDKVTLTTSYGKFTYKVKETKILDENDTSLLFYNPAAKKVVDDLVLYTCWNNGYLGMSSERLYFVCSVVSKEWKD